MSQLCVLRCGSFVPENSHKVDEKSIFWKMLRHQQWLLLVRELHNDDPATHTTQEIG